MTVLFCLLLSAMSEPAWQIESTEIFQPLRTDEVLIRSNGEVLILNFNEAIINRYDANGKHLGVIGFKGKGPGGFTSPVSFTELGEYLYVMDMANASVSQFTADDGEFVKRTLTPDRGIEPLKVSGGWVYGDWTFSNSNTGKLHVYFVDEAFKNRVMLVEMKNSASESGVQMTMENGNVNAVFTPLSTRPILGAYADGSKVYVSDSLDFRIHLIDVASRKVVHTINHKSKPIPFDTEWADEQREVTAERVKRFRAGVVLKRNYPDYFPPIREIRATPNNQICVDQWRGRPDDNHHTQSFDAAGEAVKDSYSWDVLSRLIDIRDGWAYVTLFNPDEDEAGVGRCKPEALEAFVAANTIEFDGEGGRRMMMRD